MAFDIVTEECFQRDVIDSEIPVLVKFSAVWCGPCKAVAPVIESIAKDFAGEMKFVEVDLDADPAIAERHGVRGVPAFLIFRDGEMVAREMGAQSRTRLTEFIEAGIEGAAA